MKIFLKATFLLLIFCVVRGGAQETIIPEVRTADLDLYIKLAKDFMPKRKIRAARTESLQTAVTGAYLSYFDIFYASYYYRPTESRGIDPINPYIVSGPQYGINFSLGSILQKPTLIKRAKADLKVAQFEQQDYDIELSNEVRSRYYEYLQSLAQLKINTLSAQDNKGFTETMRYKFEKGEITLDTYSQSRMISTSTMSAKILAEVTYLKAKDRLEEMIGQKIENVKQILIN